MDLCNKEVSSETPVQKGMVPLGSNDLEILIPPPPSEEDRVSELSKVSDQYRNPKNPKQMQPALDSDMDALFNAILRDAGLPSSLYMITGISRSVVPDIAFHKNYFGEPRPKEVAEKNSIDFMCDDLESAKTASYPSGHATQAYYTAKVLGDVYPEERHKLDNLASNIADSRVDRGVHFPSDNDAGKMLAEALYEKTRQRMLTGDIRYQEVFGG
jgi:acid phosphatase (class A)